MCQGDVRAAGSQPVLLVLAPMTILLATSAALPGLASDDRLLLRAMRSLGSSVEPAVWEDPHVAWDEATLCVIRSTWDYAYRRSEFLAWARRVAAVAPLWNPEPVVVWNTHKQYLVDLAKRGVPTVPTRVLSAGTRVSLDTLAKETGWDTLILKAAVAQTGRYLRRVEPGSRHAGQRHLDRLLPHEDMLVQPFLPGVLSDGETSLVYVDGAFSHAVRKQPAAGDFRVHDDFDGSIVPVTPTPVQRRVAEAALAAAGQALLYGRVDLVPGPAGPVVMELELVEPDLYFASAPGAAERMARAVVARAP
jgi:glutathione synthase/RimK-type ligase-like ATP-grasp enzyme